MTGTWIVSQNYPDEVVTWRLDLRPSGTGQWRGVPTFISATKGEKSLWHADPGTAGDEVLVQAAGPGRLRVEVTVMLSSRAWFDGTYDSSRFSIAGGRYTGVRR